ncbi:MAG TPA: protein kinase [Steroidobacteraceae bacterium]|nr:protein kinase [Steroidobacteraceae bacterium]
MEQPRNKRFLVVEDDAKYAKWLQHSIASGWPADTIVLMDWASFARVRTAMTARDYDVVMLALGFDEGIEEPNAEGFEWIRKLRSQPGFPEMIILAKGGSELVAVRTLRLGAADYLPKRLLTPPRLQRSIKLTLRAIEKEAQRRAERLALAAKPEADKHAMSMPAATSMPAAASMPGASSLPAAAAAPAPAPAPASAPPAAATSAPAATASPAPAVSAAAAALASNAAPLTSTQAGSTLARAARVALTAVPTPPPAAKLEASSRDLAAASLPAAALSLPAAAVSMPAVVKEAKPVAPPNHQIPGYTILQKIGESEAAAVYLAISEDIGHNVALKISKRRHSGEANPNDTGARSIMFQREFEAIAALDHPSIIDLYDYGIHEGVEFLAMEYFPCGDLKARLQNPLTAEEAMAFLKEIARSLKVVHDAGIIHRDLKPPNVMLRADGSVVLIDFGLARSLLSGDGSTRTGVLRGSPYYMSPEQAQGEPLDARTDLYSLGVILYEMLAGRKPYLGNSAIDVLQQHVMAPVPELPMPYLAYQPLLERLMSKSRDNRIASCDDLLVALDQMKNRLDNDIIDPATLITAGASG